jgi:chaperonin GroES
MKLAKQVYEKKNFPWDNAANVKYPLITVASIQFASRALPEIIPNTGIVKIKIIGKDENGIKRKRGERVAEYMNYQLTEEMVEWLDGTDRLLHVLPIIGTCFRKIYFDSLLGRITSKFLTCDDVIVNAKAENLSTARRVSHKIYKHNNDIYELSAADVWLETDFGLAYSDEGNGNDEATPHLFIEQHRWLDLDGDGYEEPYIVTVHKETAKVVRIVARFGDEDVYAKNGKLVRITPAEYFVKYSFIPNPDAGFYDTGFGSLLYPINSSINTIINQLIDSGTLSNMGGGFLSRGVRMKSGNIKFKPGEWKKVESLSQDLRAGIVPLPIKEPSQTLFQLLGLLINAGNDISSIQNAMKGEKPAENVSAATVLALIEQGLKVFGGIYARVHRSLGAEYKMLYRLNEKYLEPTHYFETIDEDDNIESRAVMQEDFDHNDHDIRPSADPALSLEVQKTARAQALMEISGRPGLNEDEVTKNYLEAIKVPVDGFYILPENRDNKPDPKVEEIYSKLDIANEKLEIERQTSHMQRLEIFAKIEDLRADAILKIAKAESEEMGQQLEEYKTFVQELGIMSKNIVGWQKQENTGRISSER